jgi:hypothetical protein
MYKDKQLAISITNIKMQIKKMSFVRILVMVAVLSHKTIGDTKAFYYYRITTLKQYLFISCQRSAVSFQEEKLLPTAGG